VDANGGPRTGTMFAVYLIQAGLSFKQAMQMVRTAKPTVDLRGAQISFLQSLAEEARRDGSPP